MLRRLLEDDVTVADLITALQALPPEQRELPVCAVDCDAGEYAIGGVLPLNAGEDSCSHMAHEVGLTRVVLTAERSRGCPWCTE